MNTLKCAKDLVSGDAILPPKHEQKWLKNKVTVISIREGRADKRGDWVVVTGDYESPSQPGKINRFSFRMRPMTETLVFENEASDSEVK